MTKGDTDVSMEGDDKSLFRDNQQFTQYLYSNRPFPPLWSGGGSIQTLPKGKRHGHGVDTWYDGFPETDILDYPLENFCIYVDETH